MDGPREENWAWTRAQSGRGETEPSRGKNSMEKVKEEGNLLLCSIVTEADRELQNQERPRWDLGREATSVSKHSINDTRRGREEVMKLLN